MSSKYNPFLQMVPDGEEAGGHEDSGPADLAKALEMAMKISAMVTDADRTYSQAALMASRLVAMGNHVMDEVAQAHGITVANSPEAGGYALRAIAAAQAASPEQIAAAMQALNQGYDLAMYAFLEAYKFINTLLNHPMVELQVGGMGSIARVPTELLERKNKLMMQLQSPREAKRAELLAVGLADIQRMVTASGDTLEPGTPEHAEALERINALTEALYARVNAAVKDLPNRYPTEDEEDAAHG